MGELAGVGEERRQTQDEQQAQALPYSLDVA